MRIRQLVAAATGLIVGATAFVIAVPTAGSAAVAPVPRRILSGWLPYWTPTTSTNVAVANSDLFSDASPFWHSATSATAVSYQLDATSRASVVGRLHAAGIPVIPSVTDGTPAHSMAAILANPTTRAQHVAALVSLVLANGYDGIDLDYEKFAFSDGSATWAKTRPNWVVFIRDLSVALHARGKKLTVSVPVMYDATYSSTSGYWVYDYKGIGGYVDSLRIMTYDYSFSVAGPIAPLSWVHRVATFAVTQLPVSKIRLGVPTYGYDWPASTTGCPVDNLPRKTGYTAQQAAALAVALSVTPSWNPTYGERTFSYRKTYAGHNAAGATASCTVTRTVWYDDSSAVRLRAAYVAEFKLGGIALWTLGGEDTRQWSALRTFAESIAPTPTVLTGGPVAGSVLYGSSMTVHGVLRRFDGTGVAGASVSLQSMRYGASTWTTVGSAVTSSTGLATLSVALPMVVPRRFRCGRVGEPVRRPHGRDPRRSRPHDSGLPHGWRQGVVHHVRRLRRVHPVLLVHQGQLDRPRRHRIPGAHRLVLQQHHVHGPGCRLGREPVGDTGRVHLGAAPVEDPLHAERGCGGPLVLRVHLDQGLQPARPCGWRLRLHRGVGLGVQRRGDRHGVRHVRGSANQRNASKSWVSPASTPSAALRSVGSTRPSTSSRACSR